jgi:hypothetical protein
MTDIVSVQIVTDTSTEADELEALTLALREELLDLEVASVDHLTDPQAPRDSKGGLSLLGGWLAVHLGPEALRRVFSTIAAWASRANRTVELSIDGDVLKLSGVDAGTQTRIVDEWFARHLPPDQATSPTES